MFSKLTKSLFQTYFRIKRPMTLGVRIIATDVTGRICLIRHTYVKGFHLPGGGVERNETIFEAAAKELMEETGIERPIKDLKLIGFYSNEPSFKGDHIALFHIENCKAIENFKNHEIAECVFVNTANLPKDTTRATRERIAEFEKQEFTNKYW